MTPFTKMLLSSIGHQVTQRQRQRCRKTVATPLFDWCSASYTAGCPERRAYSGD